MYRLRHISFALSELLRWAFRSMLAIMEFALSLRQGNGRSLKMVAGGTRSLSLPAVSCPVSSEDIKSTVRIFVASFFSSAVIAVEVVQARSSCYVLSIKMNGVLISVLDCTIRLTLCFRWTFRCRFLDSSSFPASTIFERRFKLAKYILAASA